MTTYGVDRDAAASGSGTSSTTLLADGSTPLTDDWDAGAHAITAEQFESDVAPGTPPLIVASTTKVDNLNADLLDGLDSTDFVRKSDVDAKGDLIAGTADNTVSRLAVGADGYVPTAKAAAATGLAYSAGLPVGAVVDYAGASEPAGWLFVYGQAISRTTYADLFNVLGTTYGAGDGSTTFNLPDARGRVIAGQDDMGGSSANRLTFAVNGDNLGAAGGAETHSLTGDENGLHAHTQQGSFNSGGASANHSHSGTTNGESGHTHPVGVLGAVGAGLNAVGTDPGSTTTGQYNTGSGTGHTHTFTTGAMSADHTHNTTISGATANSGSGNAHNNVQPTLILNKIIKYV